jgi:hydrogenase maturation protease
LRVLAIGYGNPGRLDDGLGPAMADALEALSLPGVEVLADYQLTVEDAAAVAGHDAVVFVDAAVTGPEPFSFRRVTAEERPTVGFTSHSLDPATLLGLARQLFSAHAEGYVLAIRGYEFDEFGERLSARARHNLDAALAFLVPPLREGRLPDATARSSPVRSHP